MVAVELVGEAPEQIRKESSTLVVRALALAFLVAMTDLWLSHHFGIGIKDTRVIAGLGGVVGVLLGVVRFFLPERDRKWVTDAVKRVLSPVLSPTVLAVAYAFAALFAASFTTVTVIPGPLSEDSVRIVLEPIDGLGKRQEVARLGSLPRTLTVPTTPFGQTVRIEATGYMAESFILYPLIRRRIRLGTDLASAPSVLIRPSPAGLRALADSGVVQVWRISRGDSTLVARYQGRSAALLLGPRRAIPSANDIGWRADLSNESESTRIGALRDWSRPVVLDVTTEWGPGNVFRVVILAASGSVIATREFALERVPLTDIYIPSER